MAPTRFISSTPADRRELRLAAFLERGDPLADAAIDTLMPLPKAEQETLISTSVQEAKALWALLEKTQALPDFDSRRLTHAMINEGAERGAPGAAIDFGAALCRHLIGPRYADALELPRSTWDLAPRLLSSLVRRMDDVVRFVPGARLQALRLGERYWRRSVSLTFGDSEVPFELPTHPLRHQG